MASRAGGRSTRAEVTPPGDLLPSPRAVRLRRPGWRDPRLLGGLVLVGLSVVAGAALVDEAGRGTAVLVATDTLVPGDPVGTRVEVREVRVPDADRYLAPGEADGLVVTRTVGPGELVSRSAVADVAAGDVRPVGVPVSRVPPGVARGTRVDVWWVPAAPVGGGDPAAPRQVAADVVVTDVVEHTGAFAVGVVGAVHVHVPVEDVPSLLRALADGGSVEVLPVTGRAP